MIIHFIHFKAALEKAEKDDLNELADSLGAALILEPSKPTDVQIIDDEDENADEMNSEDEVKIFYLLFLSPPCLVLMFLNCFYVLHQLCNVFFP